MDKRTELVLFRVIFLVLVILTLLLVGSKVLGQSAGGTLPSKYRVISSNELKAMIPDKHFVLINVSYRCSGYIPGTDREIPFNLIERSCNTIPPPGEAGIILYCNRGYMSRVAARKLMMMGYHEVYVLEGGLDCWELEGNPVEGRAGR